MKLLIITQKVNRNDPILGFFHRWIEEFAKKFESIVVICLEKGEYDLPRNVRVLSLGKEEGRSRLKYIWRFYKYILKERNNYNKVFVHMNEEYMILGGIIWKILGKKVAMWRNHAKGSIRTRIAVLMSNKVFYTSPQSFTARYGKAEIMPVGIDLELFRPHPEIVRKPNSILFLGRISPVKRVDLFVENLKHMRESGALFSSTIVGDPIDKDMGYYERIKHMISKYGLDDVVRMVPAVRHEDTVKYYCSHEKYVNMTPKGSMDKTIFEAIACGCVLFTQSLSSDQEYTVSKHDINTLTCRLYSAMGSEHSQIGQLVRIRLLIGDFVLFLVDKVILRKHASVLMYHSIGYQDEFFVVNPDNFQRQMCYLHEKGYNIIPLGELVNLLSSKSNIPKKTVAITFDDGYYDNFSEAFPVLRKHGFPATIFVTTGSIGNKENSNKRGVMFQMLDWQHIGEMNRSGLIDFEPHTVNHPRLSRLAIGEAEREMSESKDILERALGKSCRLFAYPKGDFDAKIATLSEKYFSAAFTVKPGFVGKKGRLSRLSRQPIDSTVGMIRFRLKI